MLSGVYRFPEESVIFGKPEPLVPREKGLVLRDHSDRTFSPARRSDPPLARLAASPAVPIRFDRLGTPRRSKRDSNSRSLWRGSLKRPVPNSSTGPFDRKAAFIACSTSSTSSTPIERSGTAVREPLSGRN